MSSIREQICELCELDMGPDRFREIVLQAVGAALEREVAAEDLAMSPAEAGLDSFALMNVLAEVEERLGVEIPDAVLDRFEEFQGITSIGGLIDLLAK